MFFFVKFPMMQRWAKEEKSLLLSRKGEFENASYLAADVYSYSIVFFIDFYLKSFP